MPGRRREYEEKETLLQEISSLISDVEVPWVFVCSVVNQSDSGRGVKFESRVLSSTISKTAVIQTIACDLEEVEGKMAAWIHLFGKAWTLPW